jgi:hypothetical protein
MEIAEVHFRLNECNEKHRHIIVIVALLMERF